MQKRQEFFAIKNGRVKMIDNGGYKTTADAIILAESANAKSGTVLDVGVGAGGVALCLLDKNPKLLITGIDISKKMLSDTSVNTLLNGRDIELLHADIFDWKTNRLFDFVVTNPPYFSGTARKDGAHHNVNIYEWTASCVKRLRARGMFFCIVAPAVMDKVIAALHDGKCGKIEIKPFATSNGIKRVIISARLGVKTPTKIFFSIDFDRGKKI
ncbi:MAG: methyltransferase [Rickettsiales bacterium]|jgi:tRNA1(Val) A37 N6-methylase TrmN6|nr:methyltransferase [Rickettsiales bacterium]